MGAASSMICQRQFLSNVSYTEICQGVSPGRISVSTFSVFGVAVVVTQTSEFAHDLRSYVECKALMTCMTS